VVQVQRLFDVQDIQLHNCLDRMRFLEKSTPPVKGRYARTALNSAIRAWNRSHLVRRSGRNVARLRFRGVHPAGTVFGLPAFRFFRTCSGTCLPPLLVAFSCFCRMRVAPLPAQVSGRL